MHYASKAIVGLMVAAGLLAAYGAEAASMASAEPAEVPAVTVPNQVPFTEDDARAKLPALRSLMESRLLDYPSARLTKVYAKSYIPRKERKKPNPERVIIFCGMINAKNGFGAYGGWQPFYAYPDSKFDLGDTFDIDSIYEHAICPAGITISEHDFSAEIQAEPTAKPKPSVI